MAEQEDSWAIVELMGHVTMAGRLTEEERFGSKLGRCDIPTDEGGFTTVYFGGSSVYRITPVTEAIARAKARANQPRPIYAYELPSVKPTVEPLRGIAGPFDVDPGDIDLDEGDDEGDNDDE